MKGSMANPDNILMHKFKDLEPLPSPSCLRFAWEADPCPKKEILLLSMYIRANLCPNKFYLAPLPKRTIFIVRKMIIKSIKTDMFLI